MKEKIVDKSKTIIHIVGVTMYLTNVGCKSLVINNIRNHFHRQKYIHIKQVDMSGPPDFRESKWLSEVSWD